MNNKETFKKLVLDLKFCHNISNNMLLKHYSNKVDYNSFATFNIAKYDEVKDDVEFIKEWLIYPIGNKDFEYFELGIYLL